MTSFQGLSTLQKLVKFASCYEFKLIKAKFGNITQFICWTFFSLFFLYKYISNNNKKEDKKTQIKKSPSKHLPSIKFFISDPIISWISKEAIYFTTRKYMNESDQETSSLIILKSPHCTALQLCWLSDLGG